jgi:hypothetical protein
MRNLRKAGGVVSMVSALVLAITAMAYAQGTTTDPNATNQTQTSPTTTTDGRTVYGTDDYRDDGPDLGWLGLLGLVGLLGLKRRPVVHDRDERAGRPAHA